MFESLFGAEMPLAIRFFLAFLVVLGLIGVTAWAVRRFGSGRLGGSGIRGRQPRLAVIDYASVDARRRLILVRRDNVEHLLMIGGPTDVVIEPNIVRAVAATRDAMLPRSPAGVDVLPRAVPLPETASNGSWPLQPEPLGPSRAPPPLPMRAEPQEPASWQQPHTESASPRPPRESLAALADEIASRPLPPRNRAAPPAPSPVIEPRAEPRMPSLQPSDTEGGADQNLAEMAQRLEAALRKPKIAVEARERRSVATAARASAPTEQAMEAEAAATPAPPQPAPPSAPQQRAPRATEAKPARPEAKANQGKALYDTLEQEMASLLGRPASKT